MRKYNMQFFCECLFFQLFFLLIGLFPGAELIRITSVKIPSTIEAGTADPTILDCIYDLGKDSSANSLVVKWFVNTDILYQWIKGKDPTGSTEFRKYIDESYKASNDTKTMYRAVKLVRPGVDLSGNIKCEVSSNHGEDARSRQMLVFSKVKAMRFRTLLNETTNSLVVTCMAEDVYPKPKMVISREGIPIPSQRTRNINKQDGRFNSEATVFLQADQVPLPTAFQCEVSIPEANYSSRHEFIFNSSNVCRLSLFVLLATQIIVNTLLRH